MGIKFCPRCGSTLFEEVTEGQLPGSAYFYAHPFKTRCRNCGATSSVLPEVETREELLKIQKRLSSRKKH